MLCIDLVQIQANAVTVEADAIKRADVVYRQARIATSPLYSMRIIVELTMPRVSLHGTVLHLHATAVPRFSF